MNNINLYKLIDAVSKRPPLYDKDDPMYHCHNKFKHRLWRELCTDVFTDWETMPMQKRIEYGRELKKRWKNLRTCFGREMSFQKKEYKDILDGREMKRRKRYEYFNRMLFLLSKEQKKEMEKIMAVTSTNHHADTTDHGDNQSEVNNDSNEIKTECPSEYDDDDNIMVIEPQEELKAENPFQNPEIVEGVSLNSLNCEEDKLFLLSLLKTFGKFDDRQRFEAKIQILQTLKKIQFPDE
ncbi:uncharacterized protein LOC134797301 [Cydia splendana]|uniref:uncharacterized protein LOC134797301 n=1 Tax=Cydia splendana TaxID=1100963 RepID=UPI00300C56B1